MASTDPEILDFWERYDAIYPLNTNDEKWIQHAVHCSITSNVSSMIAAAHGAKLDPVEIDQFLPKRLHGRKQQEQQSTDEMERMLTQRFAK